MKLRIHLFEWPSRHNVHLALPLMLVLSFALHAASMFLFHAAFPRSNGSAERIASITYILPGSPEAAKLAPILAASDPALFSSANVGPNVWNLPKTAYVASFDEETPDLKPLPAPGPSEFLPPDPGTAPVTVAPLSPRQPRFPSLLRPRTCQFGDGLERRAWTPPEGFKFSDVTALTQQGRAPPNFSSRSRRTVCRCISFRNTLRVTKTSTGRLCATLPAAGSRQLPRS